MARPFTTVAGSRASTIVGVVGPDTNIHLPVPELGAFPASVAVVVLQSDWSGPALDGVTRSSTVTVAAIPEYFATPTPFFTSARNKVVVVRLS